MPYWDGMFLGWHIWQFLARPHQRSFTACIAHNLILMSERNTKTWKHVQTYSDKQTYSMCHVSYAPSVVWHFLSTICCLQVVQFKATQWTMKLVWTGNGSGSGAGACEAGARSVGTMVCFSGQTREGRVLDRLVICLNSALWFHAEEGRCKALELDLCT